MCQARYYSRREAVLTCSIAFRLQEIEFFLRRDNIICCYLCAHHLHKFI